MRHSQLSTALLRTKPRDETGNLLTESQVL